MDIFISGLPATMRQRELQEIFEKYGEVSSVNLIMDHLTRLNKGFGFVKMPDRQQGLSAIAALHGVELEGRKLVVNESKYKKGEGRPGGPEARAEKPAKKYDSGPNRAYGKSNTDCNRGFKDKK
jgi:RNA recognition motif-containing protein